jgi:hypothetical protein
LLLLFVPVFGTQYLAGSDGWAAPLAAARTDVLALVPGLLGVLAIADGCLLVIALRTFRRGRLDLD